MVIHKRKQIMPQINYLFNKKFKNDKDSGKIHKIFIILHIFLSLDFGFAGQSSRRQKRLIKVLTLLQCISIAITCIVFFCLYLKKNLAIWYSHFCLEYIMYVVVLVFSDSEKTFFELQKDLISFDSMIGIRSESYNLDMPLIIVCLSVVVFRISLFGFYCLFYSGACISIPVIRILYFIPLFSIDTVLVIYFFSFYFVYRRVKNLSNITKGSTNIVHCHYLYKTLVESMEKVKDTFDVVFMVSLLFNAPECMTTVFLTLQTFTLEGKMTLSTFGAYFISTQSLVLVFAPTFSAGLLGAEVQKLKLILYDKLFMERDQKHTKDIERLINYIVARPLRITVCKIIPLNWNLPLIIVNFCTSYLIVAIQFTHLY